MKGFLGGLLLGVGILIAGLSGLCTLVFGAPWVLSAMGAQGNRLDQDVISAILTSLMLGGIPFLIGLGLIFSGRRLMRKDDSKRSEP